MARRFTSALVTTLAIALVIAWRLGVSRTTPVAAQAVAGHTTAVLYRCTMPECGDPGSTDPNSRCPVCGMKREPVEVVAVEPAPAPTPWYRCPMSECNDQGSAEPDSRCPVCGMKRELVTAPAGSEDPLEVALSPRAVRLAEIATEPLARGPLYRSVRALGVFEVDERRVATVSARVAGTVERLAADQTGMRVRQGDRLLEIFSLDLLEAQNDLLRLEWGFGRIDGRGRNRSVAQDLVTARHRLELLGMTPEQIDGLIAADHEDPYLVVEAPIDGTVVRKGISAGQFLEPGNLLYEIVDLSNLWLQLACYEDDLAWVEVGQEAVATTRSLPGAELRGRVSFVEPVVDVNTRTARVRVELPNPNGRLKPGMYATAWIRSELSPGGKTSHLRVPREAVLEAGGRALVYVEAAPGTYRGVDVHLGPLAEDENGRPCYPVMAGLNGDERVVTRGGFAVDSQAQIAGKPSLFATERDVDQAGHTPGAVDGPTLPTPHEHATVADRGSQAAELLPLGSSALPANERCPVHPDRAVDPKIYVDHQGVRVYLCSHRCPRLFVADPERYIPNLPDELQQRMAAASGATGMSHHG